MDIPIFFLKAKKHFSRNLLFYCIFIGLIILPFFWFSHNLYLLGEDDTGLAYYNPLGTLKIYLSSWLSGDAMAKIQMPGGEAIFSFLLYLIKLITFGKINLQLLAFAFILSISFLFIVKILELLNENKKSYAYYIAGLFYSLSAYFVIVEYYYLMPSTFVIVLAPALTFYLLKAVKTNSNKPLLVGAIWSLFLSRAITTPVFINFFAFLFLFILLQSYFNYGLRKVKIAFFSYLKLVIFIVLINAIIFIPTFYSFISRTENTISIAIAERTGANIDSTVKSLETEFNINKIYDYFANLYPESINKLRGWRNYDLYKQYYDKVRPLMYIIPFLAFLGIILFPEKKRKIILPILISFIVTSLFLFVDVFGFFKKFYIYLIIHTPMFNMNRFPSMKFHIPFVFYYSLIIGVSLYYLFQKIGPKYSKVIFIVCLSVLITINYFFISGSVFTKKLKTYYTVRAMDFNSGYKKLVKDFPKHIHDDSNLLFFPLGYGFGSFITGQDKPQIYRSTRTGFKNFTGYNAFGCLKALASPDKSIFSEAKKYYFKYNLRSLFSLAKKLNIKYIVYSKDVDSLKNYAEIIPQYTYNSETYYEPVNKNLPLFENKGYAVYKIKNYDEISKFTSNDVNTEIYFNKIADFMYLLKIKTADLDVLKMHEGFSSQWRVYKIEKQNFECKNPINYAKSYPNIYECEHRNNNIYGNIKLLGMFGLQRYNFPHKKTDNYMNGWKINTNNKYEYLAIVMDGQKIYIIGAVFSFIMLCLYFYLIFKKRNIVK